MGPKPPAKNRTPPPAKGTSPGSKLKAQLERINQATKKLADEKLQLALKVQKQQEEMELKEQKKAAKLQKAADKEREQALKKRSRWTDEDRFNLIAAYKECSELYEDTNDKAVRFASRSAFQKEFFSSEVNRARHNLEPWDADQCLRQIESLTDLYKKIHDKCQRTGGGGLIDTLDAHQMAEPLYNAIAELYQTHQGINVKDIAESGVNSDKEESDDTPEAGPEAAQEDNDSSDSDLDQDWDPDLERSYNSQIVDDVRDEPEPTGKCIAVKETRCN
ncbi:hypothetical protein HDU77_001192 [Chytriomyces hyalinus]|nr:hypothetical protein HDU77_001192 [Chytriomyces hyalinus]